MSDGIGVITPILISKRDILRHSLQAVLFKQTSVASGSLTRLVPASQHRVIEQVQNMRRAYYSLEISMNRQRARWMIGDVSIDQFLVRNVHNDLHHHDGIDPVQGERQIGIEYPDWPARTNDNSGLALIIKTVGGRTTEIQEFSSFAFRRSGFG